ncbi:MAG: amino acid carrier protein [Clostridia bacterium]|nr:amino acid carrier protein [Clostridia bacterium]
MIVQVLSGVLLPFCLFLAGGYFTFKIGTCFLRYPKKTVLGMLHSQGQGGTSPVRALTVALAGTLGVGNIAGVATAIMLGGAGAVFWMWVAALLVMALKYAEIVLAQLTRQCEGGSCVTAHGGAMYYIKEAFRGRLGRVLASVFAVLCVLCTLTLGTMIQANAAAEALSGVFGVPPLVTGVVMGGIAVIILWRGAARVEGVCAVLVPFVCLLFCVLSFAVLFLRRAALPAAFGAIFKGAFTLQGGMGGIVGVLTNKAVRYGVSRGLVSNEAGCGTAPIAHAAANAKSPAQQGFWGIFEVFVDTVLLCTLTALVILVSGVEQSGGGVFTAISAFGAVLGDVAPPLVAISVAFFAFATVLCWSHYGSEAVHYLTKHRHAPYFLLGSALLATVLGSVAAPTLVWELTDIVLAVMTLLNLAALLFSHRRIEAETKAFFEGNIVGDGASTSRNKRTKIRSDAS